MEPISRRAILAPLITMVAVVVLTALMLLGVVAYLFVRHGDLARQHRSACAETQRVYDGQFKYTEFLGKEFHATRAQIDAGIVELRKELGARPTCR